METINKYGEKVKDFILNHPVKTVFILGFVTGFIIKTIF